MTKQNETKKEAKVIVVNDKTIIVEEIGKATDVGKLDMEKFIEVAMSLPSFWKRQTQ
ncbi:hypothetical protein NST61_18440 [Caldifermentibacillus hisashii]|uniref:hypothetical protein n=1 Tax=Caldifermentibacillus hisashii TaxID=996558 RepID=UPI0034D45BEC